MSSQTSSLAMSYVLISHLENAGFTFGFNTFSVYNLPYDMWARP